MLRSSKPGAYPEVPPWKPGRYVRLRNVSDEHILLQLPTGPLRLDKGRSQNFTADVLQLEQVKQLVAAGKVANEPYVRPKWR